MKKIIPVMIFLLMAFASNAQRAVFKNNTATYKGKIYAAGDTLKLGTGSQADKSFLFITVGDTQKKELMKEFANTIAIIEKVYIERKCVFVNAKIVSETADKILIDLEGAVVNEEINKFTAEQ